MTCAERIKCGLKCDNYSYNLSEVIILRKLRQKIQLKRSTYSTNQPTRKITQKVQQNN